MEYFRHFSAYWLKLYGHGCVTNTFLEDQDFIIYSIIDSTVHIIAQTTPVLLRTYAPPPTVKQQVDITFEEEKNSKIP